MATSTVPCLNPAECNLRPGGTHRAGTNAAAECYRRTKSQNERRRVASMVNAAPPVAAGKISTKGKKFLGDTVRKHTGLKGRAADAAASAALELASKSEAFAGELSGASPDGVRAMKYLGLFIGEPYTPNSYGKLTLSGRRIGELLVERAGLGAGAITGGNGDTPADTEGYEGENYIPRAPRQLGTSSSTLEPLTSEEEYAHYVGVYLPPETGAAYFADLRKRNPGFDRLLDEPVDNELAESFLETVCEDLGVEYSSRRWDSDADRIRTEIVQEIAA